MPSSGQHHVVGHDQRAQTCSSPTPRSRGQYRVGHLGLTDGCEAGRRARERRDRRSSPGAQPAEGRSADDDRRLESLRRLCCRAPPPRRACHLKIFLVRSAGCCSAHDPRHVACLDFTDCPGRHRRTVRRRHPRPGTGTRSTTFLALLGLEVGIRLRRPRRRHDLVERRRRGSSTSGRCSGSCSTSRWSTAPAETAGSAPASRTSRTAGSPSTPLNGGRHPLRRQPRQPDPAQRLRDNGGGIGDFVSEVTGSSTTTFWATATKASSPGAPAACSSSGTRSPNFAASSSVVHLNEVVGNRVVGNRDGIVLDGGRATTASATTCRTRSAATTARGAGLGSRSRRVDGGRETTSSEDACTAASGSTRTCVLVSGNAFRGQPAQYSAAATDPRCTDVRRPA